MANDSKQFLQSIGLAEYANLFEAHKVTTDLIAALTDTDLRSIGVAPLGHRKRILQAIANQYPPAVADHSPIYPNVTKPGGRRQITVLFCDLVDSVSLLQQLELEEHNELIRHYQNVVTPFILQFGGTVTRFLGDGILAFFGYPTANERDPERALRAALSIIDAIEALQAAPEIKLQVRIGIATGEMVVSDLTWVEDKLQEPTATGEATNLAARLQTLAPPNGIVVSPRTRKLSGEIFRYKNLGQFDLRGFKKPVNAWQVTETRRMASHFEAIQTGRRLTQLCGRDEIYGQLLNRWHTIAAQPSTQPAGHAILLQGAAGMGKSRLVRHLTDELDLTAYLTLRFFCEPYQTTTALFPVTYQFQRLAGFHAEDSVAVKQARLEKYIRIWASEKHPLPSKNATTYTSKQSKLQRQRIDLKSATLSTAANAMVCELMTLFCQLYGLPGNRHYSAANYGPQKLKEATIAAYIDWLSAHSGSLPLLIVFEDVHWIDPTTNQLLLALITQIAKFKALLLVTARENYQAPAGAELQQLRPLNHALAKEMIRDIAEHTIIPDTIQHTIITRADGIPLYIEELTRSAMENLNQANSERNLANVATRERHTDAFATRTTDYDTIVPSSLQDSLMARLDRLGEHKKIAQTLAVIGREFSRDLLQHACEVSDTELDTTLHALIKGDILAQLPGTSTARFVFKHALIRDAAYNSLLRPSRQTQHKRIADALAHHFPQTAKDRPELIARHYQSGACPAQAIAYWTAAGRQASAKSAHSEAEQHLQSGLAELPSLTNLLQRDQLELGLLMALGPTLIATRGYSAKSVFETYQRAEKLNQALLGSPTQAPVLAGLWAYHLVRGNFQQANRLVNDLFDLARQLNNQDLTLEAHVFIGVTRSYSGPMAESLSHSLRAIELYIPTEHTSHASLYGQDPCMAANSYAAMAYCWYAQFDRALERTQIAIAHARMIEHKRSLAFALANASRCHFKRSDLARCETVACEGEKLSEELGYPDFLAMSSFHAAATRYYQHGDEADIEKMISTLSLLIKVGNSVSLPFYHATIADCCSRHQRFELAFEQLSFARTVMVKHKTDYDAPEIWRLHGEVHRRYAKLSPESAQQARHLLLKGLQLAQQQKATLWIIKSATSLIKLAHETGTDATVASDALHHALSLTNEGHELDVIRQAQYWLKT